MVPLISFPLLGVVGVPLSQMRCLVSANGVDLLARPRVEMYSN